MVVDDRIHDHDDDVFYFHVLFFLYACLESSSPSLVYPQAVPYFLVYKIHRGFRDRATWIAFTESDRRTFEVSSNGVFGGLPVSMCTDWEDFCDACNDSVMFGGNQTVFTFDSNVR